MEATQTKKSSNLVFVLVIALILVAIFLYHGIYKMHFQFNSADVRDYINEEVNKYDVDKRAGISKLIKDGVDHILRDRDLTQQVLTRARENKTPREMELVHSAIMQNKAYGYLTI